MSGLSFKIVKAESFQPGDLSAALDPDTMAAAESIVSEVRQDGEVGIRVYANKFGERTDDQPLLIERDELEAAVKRIDAADVELLKRVAQRIGDFAKSQLDCLSSLETPVPGGMLSLIHI